jgi:hypothetical protein
MTTGTFRHGAISSACGGKAPSPLRFAGALQDTVALVEVPCDARQRLECVRFTAAFDSNPQTGS